MWCEKVGVRLRGALLPREETRSGGRASEYEGTSSETPHGTIPGTASVPKFCPSSGRIPQLAWVDLPSG
jgi:hypothetical protein